MFMTFVTSIEFLSGLVCGCTIGVAALWFRNDEVRRMIDYAEQQFDSAEKLFDRAEIALVKANATLKQVKILIDGHRAEPSVGYTNETPLVARVCPVTNSACQNGIGCKHADTCHKARSLERGVTQDRKEK